MKRHRLDSEMGREVRTQLQEMAYVFVKHNDDRQYPILSLNTEADRLYHIGTDNVDELMNFYLQALQCLTYYRDHMIMLEEVNQCG
jgi:hypothetical protein